MSLNRSPNQKLQTQGFAFTYKFLSCLLFLTLTSCASYHHIDLDDEPCLIPYEEYEFRLCEDFIVIIDKELVIAPKDFMTDLASIPRWFRFIYSPTRTETIGAAVIHDYLYAHPYYFTRKEADDIFYNILIHNGYSAVSAYQFWLAVRVFGSTHYSFLEHHDKISETKTSQPILTCQTRRS